MRLEIAPIPSLCRWKSRSLWRWWMARLCKWRWLRHSLSFPIPALFQSVVSSGNYIRAHAPRKLDNSVLRTQKAWAVSDSGIIKSGYTCLSPHWLMWILFSVQSLSCVWLFATPWTAARQASLSITNSWSPPKLMSIESVMPSNHLILCRPLLLLPSIFPNNRVFSNESALRIRWPKYWSFSFNISPSNEHPLSSIILMWQDRAWKCYTY